MKLLSKKKDSPLRKSDTAALFLSESDVKNIDRHIPEDLSFLREKINFSYFKGKSSEIIFIPLKDMPCIIIAGLGKPEEISAEQLRKQASKVVSICRRRKIREINIILPALKDIDEADALSSIAEGICLSNYEFNKYKTKDDSVLPLMSGAVFLTGIKGASAVLKNIEIVCRNTLLCRDMINETSEKANPETIAGEARGLSKIEGLTCTVYGKNELKKMKMGLLLAVGRGSKIPPRLVVLKYRGSPKTGRSIAFVGKGITFDSGGMNLKSSGHIETMRQDMAGAAVALYALKAAAEMKVKKNITAVIPLCENMLNNDSYRPGDVFTAYNGKSVMIGNTDAEGRLILADALAWAEEKLKPDHIINIATLTGACLICFGEVVAGLLSNDDDLADKIFKAGEASGDRVWRLPLYKDYDEDLKCDMADLKNVSGSRNAGTIIGGTFLKNFIKDTPWAHLDIAGTAWYSKQRGYRPKYATGFGVRLFVDLLNRL